MLSRRAFLQGVAATTSGLVLRAAHSLEEPPMEPFVMASPESHGMDPGRLAKAYAFIEDELAAKSFPGATLAVTRNGALVGHRYWGACSTVGDANAPFGPRKYSILYSFTKAISMTVVAMLHDDGLLDFDAPVRAYIPAFTGGGKDGITLRHLLTHSAGLPGLGPAPVYTKEQWEAAVELCCAAEVEWEPGSRTAYHGTSGLFIAAEAARRVVDDRPPWHELCRQRLFEPLGAARFTGRIPDDPAAVAITPPPETPATTLDETLVALIGHPAGGFLGTPLEMLQLLNLYLDGGVWNGERLLAADTVDETLRIQYGDAIAAARQQGEGPAHEPWGLGWLVRGDEGPGWFGLGTVTSPRTFGHAGINTVIGVADPELRLALAFLTTAPPPTDEDTIRIRNRVTDLVAGAAVS